MDQNSKCSIAAINASRKRFNAELISSGSGSANERVLFSLINYRDQALQFSYQTKAKPQLIVFIR